MIRPFLRHVAAISSQRFILFGGILSVTSSSSVPTKCQIQNPFITSQVKNMTSIKNLKQRMTEWSFAEPQTLQTLPIDEEKRNFIRRDVPRVIFSEVYPTPFQNKPKLVCTSSDALANLLDMDPKTMPEDEDFVEFVSGNKVIKDSIPLSHRYGGYQFGHWADQLGDGRAILLGEYINENGQRIELQLKGAGKTPYSRFGDGRAVLRSSIREFLCSEAMFHLDIPTSRAASLIVTEDTVLRDIFYNGNAKPEKCAVVLRLASTWFRIGSLEILAKKGETKELNQLIDFILEHQFSDVKQENREDWILAMFAQIVDSTAQMVAKWMSVGFTHGVLNTDNLSLASITIDYGPFGFLDNYDPNFIPNHSDDSGRYDYESQPGICLWNLGRLAAALTPVLSPMKHKDLQYILGGFQKTYKMEHTRLFCEKLGLTFDENKMGDEQELIELLHTVFFASSADFTQAFRDMSEIEIENWLTSDSWGMKKLVKIKRFKTFIEQYQTRLKTESITEEERMKRMSKKNPRYILRNWIAQRAIEKAENGDFSEVRNLYEILSKPFEKQEIAEKAGYADPVPEWSKELVVSCSS